MRVLLFRKLGFGEGLVVCSEIINDGRAFTRSDVIQKYDHGSCLSFLSIYHKRGRRGSRK